MLFIGSACLAARFIWEQTVWTWERGPQMVGFSLSHGSGAILLLFPPLLFLWCLGVAALTVRSFVKKNRIPRQRWIGLGLVVTLFLLMSLPEGIWERIFIKRMASSPRAADLVLVAASKGDLATVRAFLSHGVNVNATDRFYLRTPLHGAAAAGSMPTIRYLISRGANVNALDRSGDSPLELAASAGHVEAAKVLADQGAQRIRGDEAQRQKAIHDQVQEATEELDRAEAADKKLQEDIRKAAADEENRRSKAR